MTLPGTDGFFVMTYTYNIENYSHTGYTYDYGDEPSRYFITDSLTKRDIEHATFVLPYNGLPYMFHLHMVSYYDGFESPVPRMLANINPSQIYYRHCDVYIFHDKSSIDFVDTTVISNDKIGFRNDYDSISILVSNGIDYECECIDLFKKYNGDSDTD